jgi:class 3 adenylate cyclase
MPASPVPEAVARHVAEQLPCCELHVVAPSEAGMSWGESFIAFFEHTAAMVTGGSPTRSDRLLATVLFEDVVGSTHLVSHHGDQTWRDLRVRRDRIVLDCVEQHGGTLVSTAGDGSMYPFPGPPALWPVPRSCTNRRPRSRASVADRNPPGECERVGHDLAGLAVHIAARLQASANPGETLVSRTVADLVAGSGLLLEPRGVQELNGISEKWGVFAAHGSDGTPAPSSAVPPAPRLADRLIVATARRAPQVLSTINRFSETRRRSLAKKRS